MAGPSHEAKRNKRRQDTVNRHARDLRQFAANRTIKLLRRWMIRAVQDRFKYSAPLSSHGQSAFAMRREETVDSLLFIWLTHLPKVSDYTR